MPAVLCLALLASELSIGSALRLSRRGAKAESNATAGRPRVMDIVVKNEARDDDPPEPEPPDWDAWADGVDQGVGAVLDGIALAQDPSLETAGSFLTSISGLASMAIPPPAGIAVGGVLGLLGGLFGMNAPEAPSNQDILDAMAEGFDKVGARLDNIDNKLERMDRKLDTMQDSLDRIEATTNDIKAILQAIFGAIVMEPFLEVHGVFREATNRLQSAASAPPAQRDSLMADFRSYVRLQRNLLSGDAYSAFTTGNINSILQVILEQTDGGVRCSAAALYRDIIAARVELAWILYMGSVFISDPCPSNGTCISQASSRYTEELQESLQDYEEQLLRPYGFERALMQASAAQMYAGDQLPFKAVRTPGYDQQAADFGFTPHPAELSPYLLDSEEYIYVRSLKADGSGTGEACGPPYDNRFFFTQWAGSKGSCPAGATWGDGCVAALQAPIYDVCKLMVYINYDINSNPRCRDRYTYGSGCWQLFMRASMCFHASD